MSKMASSLNEASLEKKLTAVTNTQESIQTLSLWCIHHRAHHKKIVDVWMKVLRKAKSSHRLALLYVANDVIQNSKRKNNCSFADSWANVLKDVMPLVRDEKIISQVERILTVWEERNIYDSELIENLRNALTNAKTKASIDTKLLTEFKSQKVIDKIKRLKKVESDSELKYKQLINMKIDVSSTETLRQLKDRANGDKFSKEFEEATTKMGEYIQILEKEVQDRAGVVELLEKAEKFYDNQRGEAKIVANAYKNFGSRVKNLKKKLNEMKNALPSPVPSPTPDAPSPVDSDADITITDASKDNTEAVDMEMSDEEVGGTLKLEDPDVASLGSAPSPEGSPVGLNIPSPPNRDLTKRDETTNINNSRKIHAQTELRPNAMTSLIDSMSGAMSNRKGSLESRLSNFMQNMSNFSPAIDSSLFDDHPATPPARVPVSRLISPGNDGGATPLKDEGSITGSTTPLQDEEREATKASINSRSNSWATSQIDNKLSVSEVIKQIGFQSNSLKAPSWSSKTMDQIAPPSRVPLAAYAPPVISGHTAMDQVPMDQNNPYNNYGMNFSNPSIDAQEQVTQNASLDGTQNDVYGIVQPQSQSYAYGANANNYYVDERESIDSMVSPSLCRQHKRNPNIVELTPSPTRSAVPFVPVMDASETRSHSNLITVVQNNSSVTPQEQIRFTLKGKQTTPLTPSRVFGTNNVRLVPTTDTSSNGSDRVERSADTNMQEKSEGENGNDAGVGAEMTEEAVSRIETIGMRRNCANDADLYTNRRDDGFSMISPPAAPRAFNWQQQQQQQPPPSVTPFEPNSFFPQQQQQQQRFPYGPPPKRFPRPRFESRRPPYPPRF